MIKNAIFIFEVIYNGKARNPIGFRQWVVH